MILPRDLIETPLRTADDKSCVVECIIKGEPFVPPGDHIITRLHAIIYLV